MLGAKKRLLKISPEVLDRPHFRLELPATLVFLWPPRAEGEDPGGGSLVPESLAAELVATPGIFQPQDNLFAILPTTSDPGGPEVAILLARRLLAKLVGDHTGRKLGILIFPGTVRRQDEALEVLDDPLLSDLAESPPEVGWNRIHLSGYAARRARGRWRLEETMVYQGPSSQLVPLFEVQSLRSRPVHWHNPTLTGRETRYIPRPEVESVIRGRDVGPLLRLSGPVGCGKSRLAWEVLTGGSRRDAEHSEPEVDGEDTRPPAGPWIWLTIPARRAPEPDLGTQLLRGLLEVTASVRQEPNDLRSAARELGLEEQAWWLAAEDPSPPPPELGSEALFRMAEQALHQAVTPLLLPLRLIVDNLERADAAARRRLLRLTSDHRLRKACRLVLIGRPGHRWPGEWSRAPEVMVPPMSEAQIQEMAEGLFAGLLMPEETQAAVLDGAAGFPLALEEGLAQLVEDRYIRQRYGNFFYAGRAVETYRPSPYLCAELDAEARRMGDAVSLRLLALVNGPVPTQILRSAAAGFGSHKEDPPEAPLATSGWLKPAASAWGPGLDFACGAYCMALAETVAGDFRDTARHAVGHLLAHESDLPEARWRAYQLLSGSHEALSPVLELAQRPPADLSQEELLDSLALELTALRDRQKKDGGESGSESELELLWVLLPLARRLDRLRDFQGELDRAMTLAGDRPEKLLAFASLQAEVNLQEGRLRESEESLRNALGIALKKDPARQMVLLSQLGRLLARQERFREARTIFEQLRRSAGSDGGALIASCDFHLGNIALHERRLDDALDLHRRGLDLCEELGLTTATASALCALGAVTLAQGEPLAALSHYRRGLETIEPAGDPSELAYALLGLARVESRLGRHTAAAPLLRRAVELRSNQADPVGEAVARLALAENRLELERIEDAQTEARMAHFRLSLLSEVRPLGNAELLLGRIDLQQRRFQDARKHLEAAKGIFRRHRDPDALLEADLIFLELALAEKDLPAVRLLARSLTAHLAADTTQPPPPWQKIPLAFTLFQAYRFLRKRGEDTPEPLSFLRRAYSELLLQVQNLDPARRHHYLFQIPSNAAVLDAATENQLTTPA